MSDYAFVHQGKAYTPNGTDLAADTATDHNAQLERAELERWQAQPDRTVAYYHFGEGITGRELEITRESRYFANDCYVTTWPGTRIGTIIAARVYRHNFGGRFVSLRVRGSNGANYYGRTSWDWGQCVVLRKVKGKGVCRG